MTFKHKRAHRLALLRARGVVVAVAGLALLWVASCKKPVSVTEPNSSVAQLVVSPKVVTLQENQVQDFLAVGLTATGDTADISVTWSATVGTVDTSTSGKRHYGHYHNGGCRPSQLVARSHPGDFTDTATITVACPPAPVASVSLTPAAASVLTGQTVQLTATPKDANGNPLGGRVVTWSSDNTTIATVSASGLVTANAVGSATITATSEGQSGASAITVSTVPVASLAVSPATASLSVGQTALLTATPKDANGNPLTGRPLTWSASNTPIATVSGNGLVTGVGPGGPVTITATSEDQSGTRAVNVTLAPQVSV